MPLSGPAFASHAPELRRPARQLGFDDFGPRPQATPSPGAQRSFRRRKHRPGRTEARLVAEHRRHCSWTGRNADRRPQVPLSGPTPFRLPGASPRCGFSRPSGMAPGAESCVFARAARIAVRNLACSSSHSGQVRALSPVPRQKWHSSVRKLERIRMSANMPESRTIRPEPAQSRQCSAVRGGRSSVCPGSVPASPSDRSIIPNCNCPSGSRRASSPGQEPMRRPAPRAGSLAAATAGPAALRP